MSGSAIKLFAGRSERLSQSFRKNWASFVINGFPVYGNLDVFFMATLHTASDVEEHNRCVFFDVVSGKQTPVSALKSVLQL